MPLRIGFDMDGVLADFAAAYQDVEVRLFGPATPSRPGDPEKEAEESESAEVSQGRPLRRRHDTVWQAIRSTPDFWISLQPTEAGAVQRIHEMMLRHRWEVFFIT